MNRIEALEPKQRIEKGTGVRRGGYRGGWGAGRRRRRVACSKKKKNRDGVGEVARGGLGEVEDLRKGSAQGRDGALHIHRFGGGDYDEGGKWDAGSPDRRKWMDLVLERGRAKSCLYIPGRWAHLIGGPVLRQALNCCFCWAKKQPDHWIVSLRIFHHSSVTNKKFYSFFCEPFCYFRKLHVDCFFQKIKR
jgi:hypothetical protein